MTKHITLALLALGFTAPVFSQQTAPAPAEPAEAAAAAEAQAAHLAPLKEDPALLKGTLPNGFSYIIRHTSEPAGRGSVRLFVDTGSLNEDETNQGISHFLEHMVFNGSTHFKRGELIPAMQKLGLGFGGDANAYTSLLQTVYMLDLPNLQDETVNFAMTILRDFADGAALTDDAIDHERGIVISELHARDSVSYRAGLAALRQMTEGTRVPDYLPIGLEETIKNAPYEVIRKYYRDNYLPRRMTLIVTGDFDPKEMEKKVVEMYSSIEDRGNPPRPAIGTPTNLGPDELIIDNPEQANTQLTLSVVNPWKEEPDTIEKRIEKAPLELAMAMLNQRFRRLSKAEDCPFIMAKAGEGDYFHGAKSFSLDVVTEPAKWQDGLSVAEQELRRAIDYGFSPAELKEVIVTLLTAVNRNAEQWETITSDAMAKALVDALAEGAVMTDPQEDIRAFVAAVDRIAQNPDLCREALKKAYESDRTKLTMSGKLPAGITNESYRAAYNAAHAVKVEAPAAEKELTFAYDHIGEPGKVVQQAVIEDIGVTTLTLSNGVKVNLKPVDFSMGSVNVAARVDGGFMRLTHKPGLSIFAESVMNQGGMEAHSADEIQRLFSGHTVTIGFSSTADRFCFNGDTTAQDLELQCKLLAANIMHPGFRTEAETQLRRRLPALYTKLATTPNGALSYLGNRAMYGEDCRFTMPSPEQTAAVTTADVKDALMPYLTDGAMEVTIVGDFKVEDAIAIVEKTFGAMPARKAEFSPVTDADRTVNFKPWGDTVFLNYKTDLDKTIVAQARPAGNGMDRHRNRRMNVLSSIVKEKLFDGIRAELGETYSPVVRFESNSDFRDAALITCMSAGVRGNRLKVSAAMNVILGNIGRGEITQDDFDCAIRPYIAQTEKAYRTTGFWVNNLANLQSDPDALGCIRDVRADVKNISFEDILDLAKEVFGKDNAKQLFVVPEGFDPEQE